ncbi:MAG: hypothetical protein N2037_14505 [Acidimicrobiales bacterium]|nr:hypothetical protein [Acidimicrobiales bacterium]
MRPATEAMIWDDDEVSGSRGDLSGIGGTDALVFGTEDPRKAVMVLAWGTLVIVSLGAALMSLTTSGVPRLPVAAVAGGLSVIGTVGVLSAWRRRIVVDVHGVEVRRLRTRRYPWAVVTQVRARQSFIAVPNLYERGFPGAKQVEYIEGPVSIALVLRNGRELSLPIEVPKDSLQARRLAELARVLDELRIRATRS